ncbi:MAG: glycosyltransferase family 2 protein, partial [Bacteroidia bacterium]
MKISVIIPAFNEEQAIGHVVSNIPKHLNAQVIVCNNGSTDNTAAVAQKQGAIVLTENQKGYGYACLKGISYLKNQPIPPDVVVFIDGDYSDYPEEMPL